MPATDPLPDPKAATPETRRVTALPEYAPMGSLGNTDAERWPTLSPAGYARVDAWREHPHAPRWVHQCGDLLTEHDHAYLDEHRDQLSRNAAQPQRDGAQQQRDAAQQPDVVQQGGPAEPPAWVGALAERLHRHTAFYRDWGHRAFRDLPLISRADLARGVAAFMPTDTPLDRVVQGTSSGTSGSSLVIPLDPLVIATDLVLIEHLLAEAGVSWPIDTRRMGLLNLVHQEQAFTYMSVMTARGGQPMARVNLADHQWQRPGDREAFLRAARPQVVSANALTLLRLAELPELGDEFAPLGFVSGAVQLTAAAREIVQQRFSAPVIDLYGLKETGPVAASLDGGPHVVVPRKVFLEAVDPDGRAVADGVRGELVVTADDNPHLPLLRYRTGDTGILGWHGGRRTISGLDGRAPVAFRSTDGRVVPSVDLAQHLQYHGALAWSVRQSADGEVRARVVLARPSTRDDLLRALTATLGDCVILEVLEDIAALGPGKPQSWAREDASS